MEDYTVEFGNELSGAIIDSFAKKAKTAVCEKKVVIKKYGQNFCR